MPPFESMPPEWIEAGKPTKEEIFQNIRDNQESFNADIEALKQTSRIDIFDFSVTGYVSSYSTSELQQFLPIFRSPVQLNIVNVLVTLLGTSFSGTLQIQFSKSTDNGVNWSPILTSPVTVTGLTAGSVNPSVSFVDANAQKLDENDMLRLEVAGLQVSQGPFHVSVYGELGV